MVLLHGLTATRRYVVMGSKNLERGGHRVIAYDARGHGRSTPAPAPDAYGYERLAVDLRCVLDHLGIERPEAAVQMLEREIEAVADVDAEAGAGPRLPADGAHPHERELLRAVCLSSGAIVAAEGLEAHGDR